MTGFTAVLALLVLVLLVCGAVYAISWLAVVARSPLEAASVPGLRHGNDADLLLVAGVPAPGIADAVETAWAAIPAPRARAQAARAGDVAAVLDAARAELAAVVPQRRGAWRAAAATVAAGGCHPNQDTVADLDRFSFSFSPCLPAFTHVIGRARRN